MGVTTNLGGGGACAPSAPPHSSYAYVYAVCLLLLSLSLIFIVITVSITTEATYLLCVLLVDF